MSDDVVPNPELRKIALDFYKGPFKFDHMGGYIWALGDKSTKGNQMFADLDAAKERCARIRGWGALQYLKDVDCGALQDEIGVMFAEAITEYWDRQMNTQVFTITNPVKDSGLSVNSVIQLLELRNEAGSEAGIVRRLKPGYELSKAEPEHYDYFLRIIVPRCGINTVLKEGDVVTFQQDRVYVDIKPHLLNNDGKDKLTETPGDAG